MNFSSGCGRTGQVEITALPEEKMPDNPSEAQKRQVLEKEGEKMLRHVRQDRTYSCWTCRGR